MMKMKLRFLVAFVVCTGGLTFVQSNNELNLDQSENYGSVSNKMKNELWFARRRRNQHLKRHNIGRRAAVIHRREVAESSGKQLDYFGACEYELAIEGDLERLKPRLDRKPNIDEILHRVASLGHLHIIQYMVQKKPPILETHDLIYATFKAAEKGHLNVVRYMVEEKPSLLEERYGRHRETIAKVAATNGHQDILLYMLDKSPASLVENDESGFNALTSAASKNVLNAHILKVLEAKGLFVKKEHEEFICCMAAGPNDNLDVVRYFVEKDRSYLSTKSCNFLRNMEYAILSGRQNVFWYVVEKDPTSLTEKDEEGNYPLLLAVEQNLVNATKFESLVQKYGIPLGEPNYKGETMAHMAAKCNNQHIIAYIQQKEPSVLEAKDDNDNTAACVAAQEGHWEIVKYLAKKNPSVYADEMTYIAEGSHKPFRGKKSIFYLCVEKNLLYGETVRWLIEEKKVPLNLRETVENRSLAQVTIENNQRSIFYYAMKNDLSILYQRVNGIKTGPTIAHLALLKGCLTLWHYPTISAIIEKTPSLFAQKDDSNYGNSVLHVAVERGVINNEMLDRLLNEKHASLSETNEKGDTLAHAAAAAPDLSYWQMYKLKEDAEYWRQMLPGEAVFSCSIPVTGADKSHLIMYIATKQASLLGQKNNDGDTAAHVAVREGHVNALRVIATASGPSSLQATNKRKNSVLHLLAATAEPSLYYFKMLVRKGVPIMGINCAGETAGHIAARNGLLELVQYMIQKEPTVLRKKNTAGRTIAFTAAENAHCRIIRLVTDKDLLLETDNFGNTIFHLIMESNSMNESDFRDTFRNIDIPIDLLVKPNYNGMSAAHLAAQVGCVWIVERIAAQNPRILVEQDHNGDSALSHAVRLGQASVVDVILAMDPKSEIENIKVLFQYPNEEKLLNMILKMEKAFEWNQTLFDGIAIHNAIESGYWRILKHLIERRKVDVNHSNSKGEPPIFTAARFKHLDMLRYLIEQHGADLLKTDDRGNNILFVAMENDDLSTLKYVLDERQAPIDVNWRNKVGDSILHAAVRDCVSQVEDRRTNGEDDRIRVGSGVSGFLTDTVLYLIEKKHANVNLPGPQNRTVLSYAAESRLDEVCAYLRDHGRADEPPSLDPRVSPL